MNIIYNIYCDESCHLEHDKQKAMVLGAIWCPEEKSKEIFKDIRAIKEKHGLSKKFEIKWTKVSSAKEEFYLDIVKYFFNNNHLNFRAMVIPDKTKLNHGFFEQDHDLWYYKMYYYVLRHIFKPEESQYRIYVDIKDTLSGEGLRKLHEVLCNNIYDFDHSIIERVEAVRSHDVELVQLTDLLIGALSYINRGLSSSTSKRKIVDLIKEESGYALTKSTLFKEEKFNIFVWQAREVE